MLQTQTAAAPRPSSSSDVLKQKALGALSKLPPFSPILNKLMASLAGEDVSFSKLGDLIEKDTVLAGNILHLVNSALYGRRSTINSVRHALSILGINKVRNSVLAMSVSNMLNQTKTPAGLVMGRFTMHSASVAILSDQIAQRTEVDYPEGAFVAGLLHDVGILLIGMGLPTEFSHLLVRYENGDRSWVECEQELLGFTHAELSAAALSFWKVPQEIQVAVRDHHNPPASALGQKIPLSHLVNIADRFVNSIGDSIISQRRADASAKAQIEALGITPEMLEKILFDFDNERQAMAQFFH